MSSRCHRVIYRPSLLARCRRFVGALVFAVVWPVISLPASATVRIKSGLLIAPSVAAELAETFAASRGEPLEWSRTGSSGAILGLLDGSADVAIVARELNADERRLAGKIGLTLKEVALGYDAAVVIVHPANDVASLSLSDIARLLTDRHLNWKDFGGGERAIRVFGGSPSSLCLSRFLAFLPGGDGLGLSADLRESSSLAEVVKAVGSDEGAIGITSLSSVTEEVRVVPIELDDGRPVSAQPLSIHRSSYPIVLPLRAYIRNTPSGAARTAVNFLAMQGGRDILRRAGILNVDSAGFALKTAHTAEPASASAKPHLVRVEFAFRSTEVGSVSRAALVRLAGKLAPDTSLLIIGHVVVGETTAGDAGRLGLERAGTVAAVLVGEGLLRDNLETATSGLDAPAVAPDIPGAFQENRRVDIWVLKK